MTQNVYDRPDFFAAYAQLERSRKGLDGAPEWPVLRSMLPDLRGLTVLDLGCGYGWFCRWAAEQGAVSITGIDVSERMLARARAGTTSPAIDYRRGDLERLDLAGGSFDLVYGSLAFHYAEDDARLFKVIHRALRPEGRLVFSIEHPILMASRRAEWMERDGLPVWPVDSYFREGERRTNWLGDGVVKYHRTMASTLNRLIQSGFRLSRIEEFCPTDEQIEKTPSLAAEIDRPAFLLVAADA